MRVFLVVIFSVFLNTFAAHPFEILKEMSGRIDVFISSMRAKKLAADQSDTALSWQVLASLNAVEKVQTGVLGAGNGYACRMFTMATLISEIDNGREEVRSYLIVTPIRDDLSGVLDALMYARAELIKSAR